MTTSYRDLYKNFMNSISETRVDEKITHDEFVKKLPRYNEEIDSLFARTMSLAKSIECSPSEAALKNSLVKSLKRLQRKVKSLTSDAAAEERWEDSEDSEPESNGKEKEDEPEKSEQKVYDRMADISEISAMGSGAVQGSPGMKYEDFKKYGKRKMKLNKNK